MDGITVLNEIVQIIEPMPIWEWGIYLGFEIIIFMFLIIVLVLTIVKKEWDMIGMSIFCSVLTIFLGLLICDMYKETQREPYTIIQYEVTFSSDVSLIEFNEKYKIIEQRGQIYVIQERENDE